MAKNDIEAKKTEVKKNEIEVKKADTVFDELDRLHQTISRRAYELFKNGSTWGGAIADWLKAESELIAKPPVELTQKDNTFEVLAALPGIEPKDVDVEITPEDLLIKAETTTEKESDKGKVHVSEFSSGSIFRSVHFPEKIDPKTAKAEFKNGMLRLTATIVKEEKATKVDIKAA
jgi:HSP20 family protein